MTFLLIKVVAAHAWTAFSILVANSDIKLALNASSLSLICDATTSIMAFFYFVWISLISKLVFDFIYFIKVLNAESRPINCLCSY